MSDELRAMLQDLAQDAPGSLDRPVERRPAQRVRVLAGAVALVLLAGLAAVVVQQRSDGGPDSLVQPPRLVAAQLLALRTPKTPGLVPGPGPYEPADLVAVDPARGEVRTVRADAVGTGGIGQSTVRPRLDGDRVLAIDPDDPCNRTLVSFPVAGGPSTVVAREAGRSIESLLDSDDPDLVGWVARTAVGDCAAGVPGVPLTLVLVRAGERRTLVLTGNEVLGAAYDSRSDGGRLVIAVDGRLQTLSMDDARDSVDGQQLDPPVGCAWELPTPGRRVGEVLVVQRCSGPTGRGHTVVAVDTATGASAIVTTLPLTRRARGIDVDPSGGRLLIDEPQSGDAIQVVGSCVDNPCDRFPATGFPDDYLGLIRSQAGDLEVYRATSRNGALPFWG